MSRVLRVDIAGGGPVGLVLASALQMSMNDRVHVRVFERRWHHVYGRVGWQGPQQGNARRQQVVTLQSSVWALLPERIQRYLFTACQFQEMWPTGPASPESLGRPRNLPIRRIEDVALVVAQDRPDVEVIPQAYPSDRLLPDADVLAICDGQRSATRDYFAQHFGRPDPALYGGLGQHRVETILGLQVTSALTPAETVLLTVAQNRFLLNSLNGRGFLNMRLTPEEALEAKGEGPEGEVACVQNRPCLFQREGQAFRCPTHGVWFRPAQDPRSRLWGRILDGLRLFAVAEQDLTAVTAFQLGAPLHRPRFSAELAPGKYGFLLGDAAMAIHFWPGRGLNTGLAGALSLSRCLSSRWTGRALRDADLTRHEGIMHMLQHRNQTRALRTIQMADETGRPRPIEVRIRAGLIGPVDPEGHVEVLLARLRDLRARLGDRLPSPLPTDQDLLRRLQSLKPSTLKVLVETGAWVTTEVGGEEVDVKSLYTT